MINQNCVEVTSVTEIKVEERSKKAIFLNPDRLSHHRIIMDGCVKKNTVAADYVVVRPDVGAIIVELKGKDVEHGVHQVEATAAFLKEIDFKPSTLAALIVSSSYPKASPTVQKSQLHFFRRFKGPLHVVTKNNKYKFEKVLKSDGPL